MRLIPVTRLQNCHYTLSACIFYDSFVWLRASFVPVFELCRGFPWVEMADGIHR